MAKGNKSAMGMNKRPGRPDKDYGTLYIVGTPIGNLEDITLRALRVLKEVEVIAAESVRHSRGLCSHYGIRTKLISYNQHNQKVKGAELISRLKSGESVALVTNAGTPGVSDPGVMLSSQALEENIRVSPVPGPSSVAAALSISGLRGDKFVFMGFLSHRAGKRRKELEGLTSESRTMVFFEAPHRLRDMLGDLKGILGDRRIVIVREMTKLYEETINGFISEIIDVLGNDQIKGEFTLVVPGNDRTEDGRSLSHELEMKIGDLLKENGLSVRDIAKKIASEDKVSYRNAYRACLAFKNQANRTE